MTFKVNMAPPPRRAQVVKPSEMPSCVPFCVQHNDGSYYVIIRLGSGSMLYICKDGSATFTNDDEAYWVDTEYSVVPGTKVNITVDVTFGG